jgi:hypothetical protein
MQICGQIIGSPPSFYPGAPFENHSEIRQAQ